MNKYDHGDDEAVLQEGLTIWWGKQYKTVEDQISCIKNVAFRSQQYLPKMNVVAEVELKNKILGANWDLLANQHSLA